MKEIRKIKCVNDYTQYYGVKSQHPLIGVICFDELGEVRHSLNDYGVYGFFLHRESQVSLRHGMSNYQYDENSLICVSPEQIGGHPDDGTTIQLTGWALLFHPTFLTGTVLENQIETFGFFSYMLNEALKLDAYECNIITSILRSIRFELEHHDSNGLKGIVASYIGLLLNYAQRAFLRQYPSATNLKSNDLLAQFHTLLYNYYKKGLHEKHGLPTVSYCAGELCLSANYFGDVVKRATGSTAQSYIQRFIIQRARRLLLNGATTAEAAYQLGFDYPQHLNRMFKKLIGVSPSEYVRQLIAD